MIKNNTSNPNKLLMLMLVIILIAAAFLILKGFSRKIVKVDYSSGAILNEIKIGAVLVMSRQVRRTKFERIPVDPALKSIPKDYHMAMCFRGYSEISPSTSAADVLILMNDIGQNTDIIGIEKSKLLKSRLLTGLANNPNNESQIVENIRTEYIKELDVHLDEYWKNKTNSKTKPSASRR